MCFYEVEICDLFVEMEDTVRILVVMAAATAPGVDMVQLLVAMVLILGNEFNEIFTILLFSLLALFRFAGITQRIVRGFIPVSFKSNFQLQFLVEKGCDFYYF